MGPSFKGLYGFSPNYEFANSTSTLGNDPLVPDLTQKPNWGNAAGSLGIANGDLFTHLIAFAPGFAAPPMHAGPGRGWPATGRFGWPATGAAAPFRPEGRR